MIKRESAIYCTTVCNLIFSKIWGRGNAQGALRKYEEAIEDYNKAIELDPNLAVAYKKLEITKKLLNEKNK